LGTAGKDFIVTSGTGSGKSLTYIGSIFHHILSNPGAQGVVAVVVYPMNALINSQFDEFERYQKNYEESTGKPFPITFGQYTGQENEDKRAGMRDKPPQILLTNYMMLELLLTRLRERPIRDGIYQNLASWFSTNCIPIAAGRGRMWPCSCAAFARSADNRGVYRHVRDHGLRGFPGRTARRGGKGGDHAVWQAVRADQIINETLDRSLAYQGRLPTQSELGAAIAAGIDLDADLALLKTHPVAIWLENQVALDSRDGVLFRGKPRRISEIVTDLAAAAEQPPEVCRRAS
jgi:hypothetical protein